jgi:RimJ/RimL family protein N-acetyltransferase
LIAAAISAFHQTSTDKTGLRYVARDYLPSDRARLSDMYADFEPKRAAQGLPPDSAPKIALWLNYILTRGRHIVVEVDGKLLGHVMLMPKQDGSVELANFLHQSIRNRGIGTQMNAVALQLARESGFTRVWLSVEPSNRAAVRSYEKVGFRRMPGSYWAPEMEMEVSLEQQRRIEAIRR